MNTKTKIITLAFFAAAAVTFAFTRTTNVPPSDLRDAVGEGTAADQLMQGTGGDPLNSAAIPAPTPAGAKEVVLPAGDRVMKVDPFQMERLINLARHVNAENLDGISVGSLTKHQFRIRGTALAGGSFQLKSIELWRDEIPLVMAAPTEYIFEIHLDGTATIKRAPSSQWNKNNKAKWMKEVSFWVKYETKRGRYPPNSIPEPAYDDDGGADGGLGGRAGLGKDYRGDEGGPGKYYQSGR